MGKLLEALKAKLGTLDKAKAGSLQDFVNDPKTELEKLYHENDEHSIRTAISAKMQELLAKLPAKRQQEINARNLPNEEKWVAIAEAWELRAGEEASALAAQELEAIVSPSDPRYPKEKLLVNPNRDLIDSLRNEILPEDPEAEEKRTLLEQVDQELLLTGDEALAHYEHMDQLLQDRIETLQHTEINAFIDHYQEGKYASKLKKVHSAHSNLDHYLFDNVRPEECRFSAEDGQALESQIPAYLSPEMKRDVLEITDMMEAHSDQYYLPGRTVFTNLSATGKPFFRAEQEPKAYAFWPLQTAREALVDALREKDYGKIRQAEQKYRETRAFTDDMMKIMGKYDTPVCGTNVNSTRGGGSRTAVPQEYLKDYVSHCKLNGLFMLHAFSKNSGISVKQLLENPAAAMRESARMFIAREGLNSKATLGAKLFNGMSPVFANTVNQNYYKSDGSLISRAFESLSGMEKDPEKRKQIAGCGALGLAAGSFAVNDYFNKIDKISRLSPEKQDVFYQHVALLPEEEIDLIQLGDKLESADWEKDADPLRLAQDLRRDGKLDYSKLASRFDQVIEEYQAESEEENAVAASNFDMERFYSSSIKAYNHLIRTAGPEEKQSPGFKAFQDKILALQLEYGKTGSQDDIDNAKGSLANLDQEIALQEKVKTNFFASNINTDEHKRMLTAQLGLQYKLKLLRGEQVTRLTPNQIEDLKKTDLKKLVDVARRETYKYCCLKTKNGSSGFSRDRSKMALRSLETIDSIADMCGILPAGEKIFREAKREMLAHRGNKTWTRQNAEDMAARTILGMTLVFGKKSFEEQAKYEKEETLRNALAKIKRDPTFRRMMQNEGVMKIADKVIIGNSSITNAFFNAKHQLDAPQQAQQNAAQPVAFQPAESMDKAAKKELWERNPLQL